MKRPPKLILELTPFAQVLKPQKHFLCYERLFRTSYMTEISKNVTYLIRSPLSLRDYNRYGIDEWIHRGWNVRVFDLTKILNRRFWNYVGGDQLTQGFSGLTVFETAKEAINEIKKIESNSVFVDLLGEKFFELKYRALARQKGKTIKLHLGWIPAQPNNIFEKIQRALLHPGALFQFVVRKLLSNNKIHPDYVVVGGIKSEEQIKPFMSKLIKAHNLDFDFILDDTNPEDLTNSHILFLDEDACYHSDYINLGITPCASPKNYFPTMNKGLEKIANAFDSEVIVAAHPRSDYKKRPDLFKFPVVKDCTYNLIKKAKLIVAHGSTSLQLAILLRKPILLVTTDELEKGFCSGTYAAFRLELEKPIINFDHFTSSSDLISFSVVNDTVYDTYIENYIKQNNTSMKTVWEIVVDELENDLKHN